MQPFVGVAFRHMAASTSIEAAVHRWAARLEQAGREIIQIAVKIEPRGRRRHAVELEVALDGGDVETVTSTHGDVYVAVGDAFREARKSLIVGSGAAGDSSVIWSRGRGRCSIRGARAKTGPATKLSTSSAEISRGEPSVQTRPRHALAVAPRHRHGSRRGGAISIEQQPRREEEVDALVSLTAMPLDRREPVLPEQALEIADRKQIEVLRLEPRQPVAAKHTPEDELRIRDLDEQVALRRECGVRGGDLGARIECVLEVVAHADRVVATGDLRRDVGKQAAIRGVDPVAALGLIDRLAEIEAVEARVGQQVADGDAEVAVAAAHVEPPLRRG